jgi:hypothetical protein
MLDVCALSAEDDLSRTGQRRAFARHLAQRNPQMPPAQNLGLDPALIGATRVAILQPATQASD